MIQCPICQSTKTKKVLTVKQQDIMACEDCKNAFTYPPPLDIDYDSEDFHGQFGEISINDLPRQWKNALLLEGKVIQDLLNKSDSVLEIGAGRGMFLKHVQKLGFTTFGVEPSVSASEIAVKNGLNVKCGYYPNEFGEQSFDLIFMAQVLEHVKEPLSLLKEIGARNKGKYLILVQTNYRGIFPRRAQHRWYAWLPEQHFWHFTTKGIKNICKILGFKYVKTVYCTLDHNNHWISRVSEVIPKTGDQTISIIRL
jgi:SAM-dependent methyltransferase